MPPFFLTSKSMRTRRNSQHHQEHPNGVGRPSRTTWGFRLEGAKHPEISWPHRLSVDFSYYLCSFQLFILLLTAVDILLGALHLDYSWGHSYSLADDDDLGLPLNLHKPNSFGSILDTDMSMDVVRRIRFPSLLPMYQPLPTFPFIDACTNSSPQVRVKTPLHYCMTTVNL